MRVKTSLAAALIALGGAGVAVADGHSREGAFSGLSNHVTKGGVMVVKADGGTYEIHLSKDFFFDGAPDPRIGFGKDGKFVDLTDFEPLQKNEGAQTYIVPASIDASEFDTIFVWCRKFSVPLGSAAIN